MKMRARNADFQSVGSHRSLSRLVALLVILLAISPGIHAAISGNSTVDTVRVVTRAKILIEPLEGACAPDPESVFPSDIPENIEEYSACERDCSVSSHRLPESSHLLTTASQTTVLRKETEPTWWQLMLRNKLDLKDTTIVYPKFVGFCVKVYNLADRIFNSYDAEYVEGTGRRWKAYVKSDNLMDSYAMHLGKNMPIRMMSKMTNNLGPYLQYMAVSVGYQWNMNNLLNNEPIDRRRIEFGFSCARFSAELYYWKNTGGNIIRSFGSYNEGHSISARMSGVEMSSLGIDLYYFLNNRRYSQMAAYGFGKIQKRSQGSFIVGFTYGDQSINIDFNTLPAYLVPYLTITQGNYNFHYRNYCAMIGYGYNWVLNPRLLYNVTLIPSLGVNHCYEDSVDGARDLFSMNLKARMALVYNLGDLFAGINANLGGHWYKTGNYSLFNATETFTGCIGWRF